jgi:hypothetical protein
MRELNGSNRLADVAGRIREADRVMQDAAREAAERALEMGHLLYEAKDACRHGQWLPFLASAGISERKAQRLMQLARSGLKSDAVSDLGLKGALEMLAKRRAYFKVPRFVREGRNIREAEEAEPGIVCRTLDELLARKDKPTRIAVMRSCIGTVRQARSRAG